MEKISRHGFLKVAAAAAMSGVTAGALAVCTSEQPASSASSAVGNAGIYTPGTYTATETGMGAVTVTMTFGRRALFFRPHLQMTQKRL